MDVLAEKYIESMKKEQKLNRDKKLVELGLYRKETATQKDYDIFTEDCGVLKYYKKVPIEVTDEEYEEICKYSKVATTTNTTNIAAKENIVSTIFFRIALVIWILGVIGSVFIARQPASTANYLNSIETYETTDLYDLYDTDDTDDSYYLDDTNNTDDSDNTSETVFSWTIFIIGILTTFVSGMIFWGISEIINLLQKIYNK